VLDSIAISILTCNSIRAETDMQAKTLSPSEMTSLRANRHCRLPCRPRWLLATAVLFLTAGFAQAFDELNAAQSLVYDRPHLASLKTGDTLAYRYLARRGKNDPVNDEATLSVAAETDAERRDVEVEFLSDERALSLPIFNGYRGNPVIIAMLEHVAQTLSAETGGGALYFRNRIRDAMAHADTQVIEGSGLYIDEEVAVSSVQFSPFRNDAFLGNRPGYGDALFEIMLSDAVPGGVLSIAAVSGKSAAIDTSEATGFEYALTLVEQ